MKTSNWYFVGWLYLSVYETTGTKIELQILARYNCEQEVVEHEFAEIIKIMLQFSTKRNI